MINNIYDSTDNPKYLDTRQNFINAFLREMPEQIPSADYSDAITKIIKEKQLFYPTIKLSDNLYKIEGNSTVYYWFEQDNKILLGAELEKEKYALVVRLIGKPNKGGRPYASDLYSAILDDKRNVQGEINSIIISDSKLTDEGFNIWAKLLKNGYKISVYNIADPGSSYVQIKSSEDLKKYFNDKLSARNYRYVLSESEQYNSEIWSQFNLYKIRKNSGIL